MKKLVILMAGKARSGKDTSADILSGMLAEKGISVCRTYFAKALKESAKEVFNLTDDHVFGDLKETPRMMVVSQQEIYKKVLHQLQSGHLKFIPAKMHQTPIHIIASQITVHMVKAILKGAEWFSPDAYKCSPRQIMQWWGTEAVRIGAYDEAWIDAVKHDIDNSGADVAIISDARFDNEVVSVEKEYLQSNVIVIRVLRGNNKDVAAHVSEAGISNNLITYEIANDGSLQDLADELHKVLFDKELLSGDLLWLEN